MRCPRSAGPLAAVTLFFVVGTAGSTAPATPAHESREQEPPDRAALRASLEAVARGAEGRGFHGVVLIAKGGDELLAAGYGFADRAAKIRNSPATLVQIGSNVKDITKVAIFQLIEKGTLALDAPLSRFFENVPADKAAISIDQLLEHRAGLPLGIAPDTEPLTKAQFLERVWKAPLEFAPGSSEKYSNAGYSLLAAIVEKLTRTPFDTHVARAILAPAGLKETGLLLPRFETARIAHGYAGGRDRGTILDMPHDSEGHLWALRGNGGYLATVRDQLAFYRALRGTTLLKSAAWRERVLPQDQPVLLAGSDGTCFFLFGSFPREAVEIALASNDAGYRAPRLMDELLPVLGIQPSSHEERTAGGETDDAAPVEIPQGGAWDVVRAWVAAYQSGDDAQVTAFFSDHAENGPTAASPERRLANYHRMRDDLGSLTVLAARTLDDGWLQLRVRGTSGDKASLAFDVSPSPPHRLRGIRVELGD
jgi:CubicO group peptidase (beta-lactamase class C family)